jgi:hypothetical protein
MNFIRVFSDSVMATALDVKKLGDSPAILSINRGMMAAPLQERRLGHHAHVAET